MRILLIMALGTMFTFSCKSNKVTTENTTTNVENGRGERGDRGDRKGPPSVEEVFKMDANKDGKLAKTEIEGPLLRRFDTIDSNSDGFITKEEFENAPKPERGQRGRRNN